MKINEIREVVADYLIKNLSHTYEFKKTLQQLVCKEKDRSLNIYVGFNYWSSYISIDISASIKYNLIEKECRKYTKWGYDFTIVCDTIPLFDTRHPSFYFHNETELWIEAEKLLDSLRKIEHNFFDVYKEPKDVKDFFFVNYENASPITMKPDNFFYKRLVFCKIFSQSIKEEYIEEGRAFFIENRPHRPQDLKNYEDFCNNIKMSL